MKLSTLLVLSAFVATFCVLQAEARVGGSRSASAVQKRRLRRPSNFEPKHHPFPWRKRHPRGWLPNHDQDDEVGGWGAVAKYLATDFFKGRPAYDQDDEVGGQSISVTYTNSWDQDDEAKTCSVSNYARQITAAKKRGFKPPSAACTRAVFNKLCSECKEDTECYLRGGEEVARQTPQCMSNRRRLRDRWSTGGSTPSYSYGGNTYNSGGYIANPSQSAKDAARAAGALTNREASRFGYSSNIRDEDSLGGFARNNAPFNTFADEDDDLGISALQYLKLGRKWNEKYRCYEGPYCGPNVLNYQDQDEDALGNTPWSGTAQWRI